MDKHSDVQVNTDVIMRVNSVALNLSSILEET
jgi:hypothetical protein